MKTFKLTLTDNNEWVFETSEDYSGGTVRTISLGRRGRTLAKAAKILAKLVKREERAEAASEGNQVNGN